MENVSSALALLPSSKEQVALFSQKLLNEIDSGVVNPLQIRAMKAFFDKVFENIKTDFDKCVREEAEKHGKSFDAFGVNIQLSEVAPKYDYSVCNDHQLDVLVAEAEVANAKVKSRQEFLKTIKEPITVVDVGTGEVIKLFPALKTSTSSVKVSIK